MKLTAWRGCCGDERGSTLAIVLLTIILLTSLALSLSTHTLMARRVQEQDLDLDRAAYVARAGFERTCADVLLPSGNWSGLGTDVFVQEAFADGHFDVSLSSLTADAATVLVIARTGVTERTLAFAAQRVPDGGGATIGVRIASVADLTLAQLGQE